MPERIPCTRLSKLTLSEANIAYRIIFPKGFFPFGYICIGEKAKARRPSSRAASMALDRARPIPLCMARSVCCREASFFRFPPTVLRMFDARSTAVVFGVPEPISMAMSSASLKASVP